MPAPLRPPCDTCPRAVPLCAGPAYASAPSRPSGVVTLAVDGAPPGAAKVGMEKNTGVVSCPPPGYPSVVTLTEQRAADAHMCRAERNSTFQVIAHSRRQDRGCRMIDTERGGDVGQPGERRVRRLTQRGDGHQTGQPQRLLAPRPLRAGPDARRVGAPGSAPPRGGSPSRLTWTQHVERPAVPLGRAAPSASASRTLSTDCTTSAYAATERALLRCRLADEVPAHRYAGPRRSRPPWAPPPGRGSHRRR